MKALCPRIGECPDPEVGGGGWLRRGREDGIGVFRGETRKRDSI